MLLNQDYFMLSIAALGAQYLTAEGWFPPYLRLLQSSCKPEQRGFVTAIYAFLATGSGALGVYLVDLAIQSKVETLGPFNFSEPGSWEGAVIFAANTISLIGMVPFMRAAGKEFDSRKK